MSEQKVKTPMRFVMQLKSLIWNAYTDSTKIEKEKVNDAAEELVEIEKFLSQDIVKAIEIYRMEFDIEVISVKRLTDNIYAVNDREVNIEFETVGWPDPE